MNRRGLLRHFSSIPRVNSLAIVVPCRSESIDAALIQVPYSDSVTSGINFSIAAFLVSGNKCR